VSEHRAVAPGAPSETPDFVANRLAAIVSSSDDAIVSKTLDGIVLTWNAGAERIFGWSAREIVGKSILLLIPPDRRHEEPDILARMRRGERIDHYETVRVRKDGTRIEVSITVSPIFDARGHVVAISKIARDVSVRARAEEQRREEARLVERLLEAEKRARAAAEQASEVKDSFLSTLSHELRTPLNAILGWSQLLASRADTDSVRDGLRIIERNALSQARLIDDLLDMSRIHAGKLHLSIHAVDLREIVSSAIETTLPAANAKGIQIRTVADSPAVIVRGDPTRLRQCVWNLLSNAVKFTPRGGHVEVSFARVASHVEIRVSDDGRGIDPMFLPHVFERFRQADPSSTRSESGLGLGLAIVQSLVEMHGGTIRAESPGLWGAERRSSSRFRSRR
jgi:PAS domain S-box-containing protein